MIRAFFLISLPLLLLPGGLSATELIRISESTEKVGTGGKESDWIYGDFLLRNRKIVAVIANPVAGRNANMTVRGVGAAVIDLTMRNRPNDQLSAFYPAGGRYLFENPESVRVEADGETYTLDSLPPTLEASSITWSCQSSSSVAGDATAATVRYTLKENAEAVDVDVAVDCPQDQRSEFEAYDGVRADRTFEFGSEGNVAWCEDEFFRQTYGIALASGEVQWGNQRLRRLNYRRGEDADPCRWAVRLIPGSSPTDIRTVAEQTDSRSSVVFRLRHSEDRPVARAKLTVKSAHRSGEGKVDEVLVSSPQGIAPIRLPRGAYTVEVEAPGFATQTLAFDADQNRKRVDVAFDPPARLTGKVTDGDGHPLPCKLTIYGRAGFDDPDFGPDSAAGSIQNCVYTTSGRFNRSIDPGIYEVFFSHGPEYDVIRRVVQVYGGEATRLEIVLNRSVDTSGWVSGELHSHSTPSGDNTSSQRGRVQNLVCEHIEFGPCTEHNRIDTYADDLKKLKVEHLMATCSGMELTGSPLPANHQNAFPLIRHPNTQDGGAPQTDANPVVQIQRLSMWDDDSDKVVQQNHPNIPQIYGDRDTNGVPDEGWREMFRWADVMEVHPPAAIFLPEDHDPEITNRMRPWMVLLNLGYRIPGVVNTDAHYNHHGSGWLRNWISSPSDDPAEVTTESMVESLERGRVVMSTGPFLEVGLTGSHSGDVHTALPGDDLLADDGACELEIRVQCPNWFDVNRVQVFLNGRPVPSLNFTRASTPDKFAEGVVKFEQTMPLVLTEDAHVIVATIGEGLRLGDVFGDRFGELQPVAVANPIFVDLVGDGFDPNGDDLGAPLPETPVDVPTTGELR